MLVGTDQYRSRPEYTDLPRQDPGLTPTGLIAFPELGRMETCIGDDAPVVTLTRLVPLTRFY
jgi:hypothetical protein